MIGKAPAGEEQRARARPPQNGRGDLRRDDGAEDIDVVGYSEPLDRRLEDLARIRQASVVNNDAGGARGAEDLLERRTVAIQISDVRAHRLDLEPAAAQFAGELLNRLAAGDERAAEALAAEAPNDSGADTRSRPDQQEVTRINRLGHAATEKLSTHHGDIGLEARLEKLARNRNVAERVRVSAASAIPTSSTRPRRTFRTPPSPMTYQTLAPTR